MGCVANVTAEKFPRQGDVVGKRVKVCFHYDTSKQEEGVCVRDDVEEPFVTIFRLDNGRHVLATECQYNY